MRLIETDTLSNQNISSALLAGSYTADAARMMFCRLFADQIAGNGEYTVYLTIQRAGAGSSYRVSPITTATVASGVTAAAFVTIGVPITSTDVITAYIKGLAGDTTTPDLICEWWEDEVAVVIGAAGAGLTAVPWNATWDAEIQSEAQDAIEANNLDHLAGTATGIPSIPAGTFIDQMMDDGTAVYDRATDSLQAIRDRGDAAWDTADVSALALQASVDDLEGRLTAIRAGYLDNLGAGAVALEATAQSILTDTGTTLDAALAVVDANVDAILVDTGTTLDDLVDDLESRLGIPSDLGSGATIAANLVDIEAQTDDIGVAGAGLTAIPYNAAWDAEIQSEVQDAIEANNLDHIAGTATAIPAIPAGTFIDQIMDDGTAVYDRTTDSLQAIRDRGDSAWDTADVSALALEATAQSILTDTGTTLDAALAVVDANVDAILTDTGTTIPAQITSEINDVQTDIAALNDLSAAQVNAEVVDALATDTYAEPGQGAPAATASLAAKINYLYKSWRNKKTQTSTTRSLYNDAGDTVDQKATDSDDSTTFTKGELGTGP